MRLGRKNVILLTIDCLRADHLGCLGYPRNISPNLDEFAKKGVRFDLAFSNGSGTPQSFTSILTSTYPLMYGGYKGPLSKERITIAETLKKHDYSTAAFHSNPHLSSYFNYDRGFDLFEDFLNGRSNEATSTVAKIRARAQIKAGAKKVLNKLVEKFPDVREALEFYRNMETVFKWISGDMPYKRADFITGKALSWLKNNQDGFFLWLHFMDTHHLYVPPADFLPKAMNWWTVFKVNYTFIVRARTPGSISKKELMELINLYDGEIRYVDHNLGLFLDKLQEMGIWLDNTYFIVTADHGEEFMEHGGLSHGGKLYDELIHVPLIICGPEIKENTVVKDPVSLLDLSPTIIDLLDIQEMPKSFMGSSLFPILKGQQGRRPIGVISEGLGRKGRLLSYRTNEWKYILAIHEEGMQNELYNVRTDPKEMQGLSEKEKSRCAEFKSKLLKHISMEEKMGKTLSEKLKIKQRIRTLKRIGRV